MKKITQHLAESRMSYWKHLGHSINQSTQLVILAIKSSIHGLFPLIFANAGPLGIYKIYKEIKQLHHVQKLFKQQDEIQ